MAFFFKTRSTIDCPTIKTEPEDDTAPDGVAATSGAAGSTRCQECGFLTPDERYMDDHRRWHGHLRSKARAQPEMVLKPFACEYCGWRFILKKDLIHHVRTHTGEKPFACGECDRRFSRVHSLNKHKTVHQRESGSLVHCDRCSKGFGSMRGYVAHCRNAHKEQVKADTPTRVESAEKAEVSHQTKEPSPPAVALTATTQSHVSASSTSARADVHSAHTSKTSSTKHADTKHRQSAVNFPEAQLGGGKRGVRFTCQFCGWGFWDKKDKNQHEWTHTGHKPYHCKECGKSFSRSHTLKLHARSHAGARPHTCGQCSKTFTSASGLRLHNKVHATVHKHNCTMCPKSFKRAADFRDHQREHLHSDPVGFARCYPSAGASVPVTVGTVQTEPYPISLSFANSEEESESVRHLSAQAEGQHSVNYTSATTTVPLSRPEVKPSQSADNLQPEPSVMDLPSTSTELETKDRQILIKKYNKLISGPKRWREPRFSCQHCGKAFHDKKDCRQHQNTHTGLKPYQCQVCGKRLSRQHSLKMHMMSHTGSKPHPCSYCSATFRDRSGQRSHELTHARNRRFECKICREIFQLESALARHLQAHQRRKPELFTEFYPFGYDPGTRGEVHLDWGEGSASHVTQNIGAGAPNEGDVQRQSTPGGDRDISRRPFRFKCTYCTRTFRDKRDWRQHEYTHTGFKPYSCQVCGKRLSRLHSLKKHMLTHSRERNTPARDNGTPTSQHRGVPLSRQRHHRALAPGHKCFICQAVHKELGDLEIHIRGAHGKAVREIVSNVFGDETPAISHPVTLEQPEYQRDSLMSDNADPEDVFVKYLSKREQHMNQSTASIDEWLALQKLKFKCSFCDKRFQRRKDWRQHENTHTGYKPYTCNICGKKLSRIQSLRAHQFTHFSELSEVHQGLGESTRTTVSLAGPPASNECQSPRTGLETVASTPTPAEVKRGLSEKNGVENLNVPPGPFYFGHQEPSSAEVDESVGLSKSRSQSYSRMRGLTKQYRCIYCGWQFSNSSIFRRHRCRHKRTLCKTGKSRLSCSSCKEIFHKKQQLEDHRRSCGFPCASCGRRFQTTDKLSTHLEESHKGIAAEKQPGSETEPTQSEPGWLKSSSTVDGDLPRSESTVITPPVAPAEIHAGGVHRREVGAKDPNVVTTEVKSAMDQKSASSVSIHRRPQRVKHTVVTCRVCQKNFSHGYALKLHLMMHASEKRYKCRQCCRCFSSKKAVQKHEESHVARHQTLGSTAIHVHEDPAPASVISIPGALPGGSVVLAPEPLKPGPHSGQSEARRCKSQTPQTKPHQCVYCGWGFWTRKDCVIHERTHTGEKPYRCTACDKSFARSYSLKLHSLTHDGLKPFRCSYCGKGFASGGYVRIHERIHTKERPYECKGCSARFSCSSSLIRHEKSCRKDEATGKEVQP